MASVPTRILRLRDVIDRTALSRSQIYRMVRSGLLPSPVFVCNKVSGWVEAELEAWLAECVASGRKRPPLARTLRRRLSDREGGSS